MGGMLGALRRRLVLTGELVAFPHTLFALPFAFMGMLLGAGGWPTAWQFGWIVAAMVGARTAAMSFNRIADRHIDAENPRTRNRPLPSGRMGLGGAVLVLALSCLLFVGAARALSPLCFALSPVALAIVMGYSYTKRFTSMSHVFLGVSLAIAPVGAWIAVNGPMSIVPVLLAVAVVCWTAGFDVIYSCQDVAFDRGRGLRSIPARFGIPAALRISTALHLAMVASLVAVGAAAGRGAAYYAGVAITTAVLAWEHRIVRPDDLSRVNLAFFTLNGWVSAILFLTTLIDISV